MIICHLHQIQLLMEHCSSFFCHRFMIWHSGSQHLLELLDYEYLWLHITAHCFLTLEPTPDSFEASGKLRSQRWWAAEWSWVRASSDFHGPRLEWPRNSSGPDLLAGHPISCTCGHVSWQMARNLKRFYLSWLDLTFYEILWFDYDSIMIRFVNLKGNRCTYMY